MLLTAVHIDDNEVTNDSDYRPIIDAPLFIMHHPCGSTACTQACRKCRGTTCSTTQTTAWPHITKDFVSSTGYRSVHESSTNCACTAFTAADHRHTLKTLSQHAVQPHSDLVCVQLRPPATSTKFGECAFSYAGRHAWNDLPDELRSVTNAATFKKHPKTHFLNSVFN